MTIEDIEEHSHECMIMDAQIRDLLQGGYKPSVLLSVMARITFETLAKGDFDKMFEEYSSYLISSKEDFKKSEGI